MYIHKMNKLKAKECKQKQQIQTKNNDNLNDSKFSDIQFKHECDLLEQDLHTLISKMIKSNKTKEHVHIVGIERINKFNKLLLRNTDDHMSVEKNHEVLDELYDIVLSSVNQ
jgi:hypothetical protein